MAATATVIAGRWPHVVPDGIAYVQISPGGAYTAGGEAILDVLQTALAAHFSAPITVVRVMTPVQYFRADDGVYVGTYDAANDLLAVFQESFAAGPPVTRDVYVEEAPATDLSAVTFTLLVGYSRA